MFNYFASLNKTAMGVWATAQFRVRNLQAGSDSFGAHHDMVAIGENGEIFKDDLNATINAAWQYCGCETINKKLNPGEETVFVVAFDVPEAMTKLVIAPTVDLFSTKPIASPRFLVDNFDQIPAWKPKK